MNYIYFKTAYKIVGGFFMFKNSYIYIMLKRVVIILSLIFTGSLSFSQELTNEEKAKEVAVEYIVKRFLEDPTTYRADEYSGFEEVIGLTEEAEEARENWQNAKFFLLKEYVLDTTGSVEINKVQVDSVSVLKATYDSFEKQVIGYKISHKFRSHVEEKGTTVFFESEFVLDENFNILESTIKAKGLDDIEAG